ncbi:Fc.00g010920.m01.CDS01 [Cosmosporella sp. VM-42]
MQSQEGQASKVSKALNTSQSAGVGVHTINFRPSNARLSQLVDENARLRESLRRYNSQWNNRRMPNTDLTLQAVASIDQPLTSNPETLSLNTSGVSENSQSRSQGPLNPSPATSANRQYVSSVEGHNAHFHGPSSVMFDETPSSEQHSADQCFVADAQTKNQLLANTTRQRKSRFPQHIEVPYIQFANNEMTKGQLEVINLQTGKLDFDDTDSKLGMDLLSGFWNRQHYSGTIVYRPIFMRDMACQGPYFSKLLLNAMLFAASKYGTNTSADDNTGRSYRRKFEEELYCSGSDTLLTSKVTTIQALLIVADALFSWCDERSLSWHYMGIAINMIVDLGIHVEASIRRKDGDHLAENLEVQRRLFWAAFVLDKVQSIYQGRPPRLREMDNRVPIQFLDEFEELEPFNTLTYAPESIQTEYPTYSVSGFEQLCKLSIVMDRILSSLYAERFSTKNPVELLRQSRKLHDELKQWREMMPVHLKIQLDDPKTSTILPHTLSLLSMYNSLVILLHRPFVSEGHLQSVSESAANNAFATCATAAFEIHQILQLYRQHFCMKTVPYFVSYATYVSATIHVRIAAQRTPPSEAHRRLRNCLDVLAEHQVKCHAPKRTMSILRGLMRRLRVHVDGIFDISYSSCSGVEAPVVANASDNALGVESDGGSSQPVLGSENGLEVNQANAGDHESVLDPMFTDLDMDEIMRSFVYIQHEPTRSDHVWDEIGPSTPIISVERNAQISYSDTLESVFSSPHGTVGITQTSGSLSFLDPLFGLDAAFN